MKVVGIFENTLAAAHFYQDVKIGWYRNISRPRGERMQAMKALLFFSGRSETAGRHLVKRKLQ